MKISTQEELLNYSRIELEKEYEDIKLLQSISMELICEDNMQILFEKIIDAAMQIMNAQYASMQMLHAKDDNNGNLELLAFRGFNEKASKFWKWVSLEESGSTCGEALRKGYRVIVPNVRACDFMQGTEDQAVYLQTGINAVQSTPLYSRSGKLIGMISTHWSKVHQPSERELRVFDVLSRQVADLIEQKQTKEKIQWDKERAEILYEVTEKLLASDRPQEIVEELCVRVMKFLKCDVFFNHLIDEEKMKLCLNSYAGISNNRADEIYWLDYGVAVCGCVAKEGSRIVANKIQETL